MTTRVITKQLTIFIEFHNNAWQAMFRNSPTMPNGEWLPLPFTHAATAKTVGAEMHRRFADATVWFVSVYSGHIEV